ncbi:MAG: hypothetical protein NZ699_14585 [Roseiflexus sp.]|nr:hypothetical protein [Roseiflexus sp.]MCS7290355.1 hypothetical protein [Roseiflexus sp.]MDW8144965.1 hypothetical protein [Roseiflexaceae bacterium]MDW8233936.1 hypothetical protein [Roseiflexaceae bacterium]
MARLARAAIPHVVTALVATAMALGIQRLLPAAPGMAQPTAPVGLTTPLPSPAVYPSPSATPSPQPTEAPLAAALTRQELIDLRAQDDRLWAAMYLLRALNHLADAEASLRVNDFARVEQTLIAADDALAQAYMRAADADRDPIVQIRRDIGSISEDLYLRPEGMDVRLMRVRQAIMTLIEARR